MATTTRVGSVAARSRAKPSEARVHRRPRHRSRFAEFSRDQAAIGHPSCTHAVRAYALLVDSGRLAAHGRAQYVPSPDQRRMSGKFNPSAPTRAVLHRFQGEGDSSGRRSHALVDSSKRRAISRSLDEQDPVERTDGSASNHRGVQFKRARGLVRGQGYRRDQNRFTRSICSRCAWSTSRATAAPEIRSSRSSIADKHVSWRAEQDSDTPPARRAHVAFRLQRGAQRDVHRSHASTGDHVEKAVDDSRL